ncbi:hypothetical protein CBA19CS22_00730 [Caballeronia novacaledonica]|uniref:Uncharacterized protein n=1 Tax=Caballeronia novacaledonica TaxID=1544861 RepID=A0ACB5QJF7_9BURK|nr:hypothetical protein CBA19CS22_00730 [Caballeronia novacaledonica]
MREIPMLFSGAMVRAILDGRKTQTRRVVKSSRAWPIEFVGGAGDREDPSCYGFEDLNSAQWWTLAPSDAVDSHQIPCPYGAPGDRLWVREACGAHELREGLDGVRYAADGGFVPIDGTQEAVDWWIVLNSYRGLKCATVPPIHMPRWASRITLEITGVRVERLQEISQDDAEAEGINFLRSVPDADETLDARGLFHCLWDGINGDGAWAANPWVWVVEFKRAA